MVHVGCCLSQADVMRPQALPDCPLNAAALPPAEQSYAVRTPLGLPWAGPGGWVGWCVKLEQELPHCPNWGRKTDLDYWQCNIKNEMDENGRGNTAECRGGQKRQGNYSDCGVWSKRTGKVEWWVFFKSRKILSNGFVEEVGEEKLDFEPVARSLGNTEIKTSIWSRSLEESRALEM